MGYRQNHWKTYIRINSELNANIIALNPASFVWSLNLWDMFHVCLLSVVLFHSIFLGIAVKLKVEVTQIAAD